MLFGAGNDEEARQFAWLEQIMASADGRRIAWFTHRPLFIDAPDEGDTGYWSVKPAQRAKLLGLVSRHAVALVATGHLHKWNDRDVAGCRYVWCASSGFLVGPDNQRDMPGEKRHGILTHPALMAQLARPQKTHPINRGLFVRTKLLCQELQPPAVDVPQLPDAPVMGVTAKRCLAASARNCGSFMVASKAVRSAASRSAGTSRGAI
jgi:hypothetical protein